MIENDIILSDGGYVYAPEKLNCFLSEQDLLRIYDALAEKNALLFGNFDRNFGNLEHYIEFVYENESGFLRRFAQGTASDVTSVSSNGQNLFFSYILYDGPTVSDFISLDEFEEWAIKVQKF